VLVAVMPAIALAATAPAILLSLPHRLPFSTLELSRCARPASRLADARRIASPITVVIAKFPSRAHAAPNASLNKCAFFAPAKPTYPLLAFAAVDRFDLCPEMRAGTRSPVRSAKRSD
jgi:hypothetical protein